MSHQVVLFLHICLIILVAFLPFMTNDINLLFVLLIIHFTVSTQWHIVGGCVLSPLERSEGEGESKRSVIVEALADYFNTRYEVISMWWVYLQNYIPGLVCITKIYTML